MPDIPIDEDTARLGIAAGLMLDKGDHVVLTNEGEIWLRSYCADVLAKSETEA